MNLGENIYKYRTQRNMSQGDLADALDVSRQSVSKWENNNAVPELDKLVKMAELFGVSLDELVGKVSTGPASESQHPASGKISVTAQKVIGILLVCFGGFIMLMMIPAAYPSALLSCLLLGMPFLTCGAIFLKVKHHPGFFSLVALYLLLWLPMGVLAPNYIRLTFAKAIQILHMLGGIGLGVYGNKLTRRGTFLRSNQKKIILFSILSATVMISFLFMLFPGLLPTPGLMRS